MILRPARHCGVFLVVIGLILGFWPVAVAAHSSRGSPVREDEEPPTPPAEATPEARAPLPSAMRAERQETRPTDPRAHSSKEPEPGHWGLGLVPRFTLSSDEGVGLGVRGTAFWYKDDTRPYKTAVSFQAFATTRLVQHHFIRLDAIDVWGLPLRVTSEVGYFQTITFNYCGEASEAHCSVQSAAAAADELGLVGEQADRFVRRYHMTRFLRPYTQNVLRWRLGEKPHRPEWIAGYRGHGYIPGDFVDENGDQRLDFFPYPGSRYAKDYPAGEPGFASVLQLGFAVDDRDHEPDPQRGYVLEASLRAAAPWLGSTWTFGGANVSARLYVPLLPARALTLASRVMIDGIVGDAPFPERVRTGGFTDFYAFGGADMGRGIRQQRYAGDLKAMMQHELRGVFGTLSGWSQDFRFGWALYLDAGVLADSLDPRAYTSLTARWGFGVGSRIVWNENFVMRIDVGWSPAEGYAPYLYTKPDHPF